MLKSIILSLPIIFSSIVYSQDYFDKSYGELGKYSIEASLERVLSEVVVLVHSTPPADTKKLRKEIGNLKLLIDVFSFAYPKLKKSGHKTVDPLLEFRKVLDEGYEIIGQFKDLSDSGPMSGSLPSGDELLKLRSKSINWKKKLLEHIKKENIKMYLSAPLTTVFQNRDKDDLHKYTWAQISLRPNVNLNGVTTIRSLCSEVLRMADSHLSSMVSFDDLFEQEREDFFHSVRKEMRIVLKLSEMVIGVFDFEMNNSEEKKVITLAVEKFGSVHDLIMALHRAQDKKNTPKIRELKPKLNVEFNSLKNWANQVNLSSNLDILSRELQ